MKTEIIPVIHIINEEQVSINIDICIECGIKKVFLINHAVSIQYLFNCSKNVRNKYPNLWIGINMLGTSVEEKIGYDLKGINGLWCDETLTKEQYVLLKEPSLTIFGGLAFKYQPQPSDLESACKMAEITTDVATTSGAGTGKPANINKIKDIRKYLGEHPMAIASGVSVDNILDYKGIADYLLVATSITSLGEMIIKEKLLELTSKIK